MPKQFFPAGSIIQNARIGDVNSDGRNDLLVTANVGSALLVYEQEPDGTLLDFLVYGAYAAPKSFEVADMDGDGLNDVVVNNVGEYTGVPGWTGWPGLSTYLQRSGILAFDHQVTGLDNNGNEEPEALAVADFNADGCKDVLVAASGAYHRLYGYGCVVPPAIDTAVQVDSLDWRSIVTVRAKPDSAGAAKGVLRVHFVSRTGDFDLQYAPPECVRSQPVARTVMFQCAIDGLAPGASAAFQFNYLPKRALDESLRIYAAMEGAGFDPDIADNRSVAAVSRRVRPNRTPLSTIPLPKPVNSPAWGRLQRAGVGRASPSP